MKNLTHRLKYFLLLFCGLFVLSGYVEADTFQKDTKIYLRPNSNWEKDGASFKAKFYQYGGGNYWLNFSKVGGTDGLYVCTVPGDNYDHINIYRYGNNGNNEWNHIWNIPAKYGKNQISINDGTWDADNSGYSWGVKTYRLAIQGEARFYGASSNIGWGTFENPNITIQKTSDTGEFFIYATGDFKVSSTQKTPNNWDVFNASLVRLTDNAGSIHANVDFGNGSDSNVGSGVWVYFKYTADNEATAIVMSKEFPWLFFNKGDGTTWETSEISSDSHTWTDSDLKGKKANLQYIDGTKGVILGANADGNLISGISIKKYTLVENGTDFQFPEVGGQYTLAVNSDGTPNVLTVTPPTHTYQIYYKDGTTATLTQGKELSQQNVATKQFIIKYKAPDQDSFANYGSSGNGSVSEYTQTYSLSNNETYFTLPDMEGTFKFLLTVDNNGKPTNVKVIPPVSESKLYIGGAYHGGSNWFTPSEIRRTNGEFNTYTIAAEAGNKFRFYSVSNPAQNNQSTWIGPNSDTKINGTLTGNTANSNKPYIYEFQSAGTYEIKVTGYSNNQVTFDVTKKAVVSTNVPKTLFLRSSTSADSGWPNSNLPQLRKEGNVFTYTLEKYTPGTTIYFQFRENSSNFNGARVFPATNHTATSSGVEYDAEYNTNGGDPGTSWTFTSNLDYPVVFKVDFNNVDANKNGVKVSVIQEEPVITGPAYWLHARFNDNWNSNKRVRFTPSYGNSKVLTAVVTYKEYLSGNQGFKITNKEFADNGDFYTYKTAKTGGFNSGEVIELDVNRDKTANITLNEEALNQEVTLTLTLNEEDTPATLTATWSGTPIKVGDQMKVYPNGVSNASGLKRYQDWPVLYLQGRVLNNTRVTPEYQMTKVSEGRYELEFTARDTRTQNAEWKWEDGNFYVEGFENANSDKKTFANGVALKIFEGKEPLSVGVKYKAVCEQNSNGTWTLSFTEAETNSKLPFISMIGKNWKQREKYNTPHHSVSEDKRTTESGWQEAWVQYDNRGQVLKDREGNVMYNTMWPPKNPILFKTEFTLNGSTKDFTLTSKDLTFKVIGTKTGAEWKNDERFAAYTKDNLNEDKEYISALALRDDRTYTLYRVEDMWINGDVKLWTGWGGLAGWSNGKYVSNWSMHKNWGRWDLKDYAQEIHAGSTIPLGYKEGDMKFDKPTFFKYVDFFYDEANDVFVRNDDTNLIGTVGASVLFTERAKAGAQIAAISTNKYTEPNFQASLTDIANLAGAKIKSVVIRSYETVGDAGSEEMKAEVFDWTAPSETTVDNFHTLFEKREVSSEFETNNDPVHTSNESTGKWVYDKFNYTAGDYFYRMTVVIEDGEGEHTIIVDSNPFSIVKPESITVSVYQLVKVGDEEQNGVWKGHYYTYKTDVNDPTNKPQLPVYELWIENDSKFDGQFNVEYDANGDLINGYIDDTDYSFTYDSLDELPDYGAQNLQFTDKVLVVGSVPSASDIVGYSYAAKNENNLPTPNPPGNPDDPNNEKVNIIKRTSSAPMKAEGENATDGGFDKSKQRAEYGDRFMYVTNVGSFLNREFELKMKYTEEVYSGETVTTNPVVTEPATTTYAAVVPTPVLKAAKVQVAYGDPNTPEDDMADFTFRGKTLENARYHSVRDYIEVDFPNVSRYLGERMQIRDFFSLQLTMYATADQNNPEGTTEWNNVFTFASDQNDQNTWETNSGGVVVGDVMHPNVFNKYRKMSLVKRDGFSYYNRWTDGSITPIEVTDNAPKNFVLNYEDVDFQNDNLPVGKFVIYKGEDDNYYAATKVRIKHSSNPSAGSPEGETTMSDDHNYIVHKDKKNFEHLHHHSANDYYYVAIIDENYRNNGTTGDEDAIIDINGNKVTASEGEGDPRLHFVVPATELFADNGIYVTIHKYLGKPEAGQSLDEFLTAQKQAPYTKNLKVLVSYLYPFAETTTAQTNVEGMSRVVKDYSHNVLKSQAAEVVFPAFKNDEIVTAIPGLVGDLSGRVTTGAGFIDVDGRDVEIYSASGVKVGEGAGRHEVANGVYVVRYNGRTVKVVVR